MLIDYTAVMYVDMDTYAIFTCLYWNINGLRNKLPHLRHNFQAYDVIALCETKLNDSVTDSTLMKDALGESHALFRRDRTSHGGGVACFVRSELQPERIHPDPNGSEILVIYLRKISVLIAVVYRPPNTEDNERTFNSMLKAMSAIAGYNCPCIITGDFNFTQFPITKLSTSRLGRFMNHCANLGLKQCVSSPTRGKRMLDLVFTKNLSSDVTVHDPTSWSSSESDHKAIEAVVTVARDLANN